MQNPARLSTRFAGIGRRTFLGRIFAGVPLLFGAAGAADTPSKDRVPGSCFHGNNHAPEPLLSELAAWQGMIRVPVWEESGGNTPLFVEAIRRGEVLYGTYGRWSTNHEIRRITPLLLFRMEEPEAPWPPPGGYVVDLAPA